MEQAIIVSLSGISTEVAKMFGFTTKWAFLLSTIVGGSAAALIAVSGAYENGFDPSDVVPILNTITEGLIAGAAASGLYSGIKKMSE